MIAKPEWFSYRKYGGWGLFPKTVQGWIYTALILLPLLVFSIVKTDAKIMFTVTSVWIGIFAVDIFVTMLNLKKDERESLHEALAERNAAWAMVASTAAVIAYQASKSIISGVDLIDPALIGILFIGLITKAATNIYLVRRG